MDKVDLTQINQGETAVVVDIRGGYGLSRRLETMGIKPGVMITKVSSQLMRGPITLRVGNSQIAIGFGMARKIIVKI
ncbi:MAG: ferrous iron transport protein A [Candidatus Marinimicrobia bacterium]|nr:ferrous iron transport protein A [Candidatus Neomarinimicrobiota bacterium]MCK4448777.1 ferrous iron transport protein A [Candidatus Neomarinimicrobiota bacterium]